MPILGRPGIESPGKKGFVGLTGSTIIVQLFLLLTPEQISALLRTTQLPLLLTTVHLLPPSTVVHFLASFISVESPPPIQNG